MEAGLTDAIIARGRALQAVADETDVETGQALWRLALKFHQKVRETRPDWFGHASLGAVGRGA